MLWAVLGRLDRASAEIRNSTRGARGTLTALAAVIGAACGDLTGADEVTLADFAGTWNASQLLWTERVESARRSLDLVHVGGRVSVTIAADGSLVGFGSSLVTGGFTMRGEITLKGPASLSLDLEAEPDEGAAALGLPRGFACTLSGGTLTLSNLAKTFDFVFDGTSEPATLVMARRRN